jgi:hypothetical protein
MRLYAASSEETLRAQKFLKDWAAERLLTKDQYHRLEQETVSDLRTTNIFLRLVLFLFTLVCVGAAAALFFDVFLSRPSQKTSGIFFLIFAAICYAAAEVVASKARLYRYGIEEALAVWSVGFLCAGLQAVLFNGSPYSSKLAEFQSLVPAAGAVLSLWIWRRFGFSYAFLAAMIFVLFLPGHWTSSHAAQRAMVTTFYVAGLIGVVVIRSSHRFDYLEDGYSLVEAFLWLGIYLAINLQLSSLNLAAHWGIGNTQPNTAFATPFYWTTWVLTWCLPPLVLARGVHRKDRFVLVVGGLVAILTFVTNKPYLGWPRHSWDPMLLGILLTGVALFLRRWLASGPGGVRHGFTSARLSEKDKYCINAGSAVLGLVSPQSITPTPHPGNPDFGFGGGASGGGGTSGDF